MSTMTFSQKIKPWVVVLSASLFFFYEFVQMNMFNTINGDLMRALSINATQVSNLSAFYFYADVIFLFPAGIILDYFSTRWLIAGALGLCTIATIALSFADSYVMVATLRTLSGVGAAFCLLSAVRLATRWFPAKNLAMVTGFIVTMAFIGGAVAQAPFAILNEHFGWRQTVFYDGLMGILFIAIILWQVRDYPAASALQKNNEKLLRNVTFWQSIFMTWKNPQNWLGGLYTSFINLPILILGALWGSQFLVQVHHYTPEEAGTVSMMLYMGALIGCPVLGRLSDQLGRRKIPMIIGAIISIVLILAIMYVPSPSFTMLIALFFLLGFVTSIQIIGYPLIAESNPNALVGTATGWAAVLIMGGGAFGQPLFGWLLDRGWDGTKVNGVPVYTASDFHFALTIFPIMFTIALLISLLVRETYGKAFVETGKNK